MHIAFYKRQQLLIEHDVKIAGITELWASIDINDAKFQINNLGGGVLLHVHKSIKSTPCDEWNRWDYNDCVVHN